MSGAMKRLLPPKAGVKWGNFGFGLNMKDHAKMVVLQAQEAWDLSSMEVKPYAPIALEPSATILNYGQGIFEGMKAHRTAKDRIVVFRPERNAMRFHDGATAYSMPPVPTSAFLRAVQTAVQENVELVPPHGEGALYLRPILFGSGGVLGLGASTNYHFLTYAAPVGEYFKGSIDGARMKIERKHHRAANNGSGNSKGVGNYAPCFKYQKAAQADGYTDIIYMDAATGETVEEVACANLFVVEPDKITTPPLGTILPGITRASIIHLVKELSDSKLGGRKMVEGPVTRENFARAEEVFCTGTATVLSPIKHVGESDPNSDFKYDYVPMGPISTILRETLTGIQMEEIEDPYGWMRDPFSEDFCRD